VLKKAICVTCTLLAIGLLVSGDAQAQWGSGMGGRRGGMGQGRSGSDTRQDAERPVQISNSSDQIQVRLDSLHAELQLTPTQEPQWTEFAEKFNRYLEFLVKEKITQAPFDPSISGAVYVSKVVDSVRNRYTVLEELEEKTKQLYPNLSRTQKLQFDTKIQTIVVKEIGR
jgi:hypothetical protein